MSHWHKERWVSVRAPFNIISVFEGRSEQYCHCYHNRLDWKTYSESFIIAADVEDRIWNKCFFAIYLALLRYKYHQPVKECYAYWSRSINSHIKQRSVLGKNVSFVTFTLKERIDKKPVISLKVWMRKGLEIPGLLISILVYQRNTWSLQ